jgi:hypothetical protein
MKQYYRQLRQRRKEGESRILKWSRNVAASRCRFHGALLCQPLPMPPVAYLQQREKATREAVFIKLE